MNQEEIKQLQQDAAPSDAELKKISVLAIQYMKLEAAIAKQEEEVKTLKSQLQRIAEVDLPEALATAGTKSFTLETGQKVSVDRKVFASFPSTGERHVAAMKWLDDTGNSDLVKRQVTIKLNRDDQEKAAVLLEYLRGSNHGYDYDVKETVHSQTLAAFIREQLDQNADVPLETIGAHVINVATVKGNKRNG